MLRANPRDNNQGDRAKASSWRKTNLDQVRGSKASRSKVDKDSKAISRDNRLDRNSRHRMVNQVKAVNKASNRANAGKVRANNKSLQRISNAAGTIRARRKRVSKANVMAIARMADNAVAILFSINLAATTTAAVLRADRLLGLNTHNGLTGCVTWKRCWMFLSFGPRRRAFGTARAMCVRI